MSILSGIGSVMGFGGGGGGQTDRQAAQGFIDPLSIWTPGTTPEERNNQTRDYGNVVGGGFGDTARQGFQDKLTDVWNSGAQGRETAAGAADTLGAAAGIGQGMTGAGAQMRNDGINRAHGAQDAAAGFGADLAGNATGRADALTRYGTGAARNLTNTADTGASAIMGAAAQQGPSLAQAQFDRGQLQAREDAMSLAATQGRGGNAALAGRQAQQALAGQGATNNANNAMMRAQEEAGLRNSRIAAATQAGQLRTGAAGQAGQIGNSALQGAGAISNAGLQGAGNLSMGLGAQGLSEANMGNQLQGAGLSGMTGAAAAQGGIGTTLAGQGNNTFTDLSTAQLNADMGFGTNAQTREAEKEATTAGLASGIFGAFM